MTDISANELMARLQQGEHLNLLDVRESIEFYTYNIGGKHIPLAQLKDNIANLVWNKTDEIIVVCRAGLRSATAKTILEAEGYQNIKNLVGGLMAYQKNQQK